LSPSQLFVGSFLGIILLGTVGFKALPGLYAGPQRRVAADDPVVLGQRVGHAPAHLSDADDDNLHSPGKRSLGRPLEKRW